MDDNSINTVPERADSAGYRMRILSALAISFVVLGHMNFTGDMTAASKGPLTFGEWFPYYSFHLALFLSFFPQLLQGPISRYDQLASQLLEEHHADFTRIK